MKKILAITLFMAGFAMLSQAQQAPATQQETKKAERKQMMADLHLNADQEKQMKEVNQEFKEKAKVIKENQSLSKKQKREQITSLYKERTDKLSTFLTPEQQTKMKEQRKKGMQRQQERS